MVEEFGTDVLLDGSSGPATIDRKKLGAIVFSDRQAMKRLEQIVWPRTRDLILESIAIQQSEWANKNKDNNSVVPVIVVEAAVLLDADWHDKETGFLDGVWVVNVSRETAVQRLMENRGLDREEAIKRIEAQESRRGIGNLDQEVKQGTVSAVIDNNGDLDGLKEQLASKLHDPSAWY